MRRIGSLSQATVHEPQMNFRVWRQGIHAPMRAAHTHPDVELNWMASGQIEYLIGGVRRRIGTGELGLFWGGMPHQVVKHQNCTGIWLTLPLAWLLNAQLSNNFTARLMSGNLVAFPFDGHRAEQWLSDFDSGPQRSRLILLEIEAILERIALKSPRFTHPKHKPISRSRLDVDRIDRVIAHLTAHYQEPVSVDSIAAEVKLHPKYLMTLFKRVVGGTINQHLNQLRIAHAQRLLATTGMSVIDVGLHSGFGSPSRFHVAFRKQLGMPPARYRRKHQSG
jgi:AraC family transcriptional regulator, melibiose operon regulatory protein